MSEDSDHFLVDKEELLETYRKLLGETKRKPLPEISEDKRKLAETILSLRTIKEDTTLTRATRIKAENLSFEYYERFLGLCGGDTDLVSRILYGKSKAQLDAEAREREKE
jgi:hypothetical protein